MSILYYSLRRHITAIAKLAARGMFFWDYGNAFMLEASRAGKKGPGPAKAVVILKG